MIPTTLLAHGLILLKAFSSPEAAILLVCARNRDVWPLPISEHAHSTRSVFFSQSDLSYLTMSFRFFGSGFGSGQRSRFLAQTRRIAASGNENVLKAESLTCAIQPEVRYFRTSNRNFPGLLQSRSPDPAKTAPYNKLASILRLTAFGPLREEPVSRSRGPGYEGGADRDAGGLITFVASFGVPETSNRLSAFGEGLL